MTPARRFPLCPALPGSECRVGGGGRPSLTCYLRPPFQTAHADFPHAAFTGYSPSGGSSSPCLELHGPLPTWSPPCPRGSPQRQRLGHCRSNHQSAGAYSPAPARGSHSRRDPFPLTGAFWATSPPPLIETIPRLSPRFLSTVGHSDFSHGIPGDFAGSLLIRPGTRPVERDRTRSPGVTRAPSPPCRPHTPCCGRVAGWRADQVGSTSLATVPPRPLSTGQRGRVAGWRASQGTIKEPDYVSTWPPNHPGRRALPGPVGSRRARRSATAFPPLLGLYPSQPMVCNGLRER